MTTSSYNVSGDVWDTTGVELAAVLGARGWTIRNAGDEVTLEHRDALLELYVNRTTSKGYDFHVSGELRGSADEARGLLEQLAATLEQGGLVYHFELEADSEPDGTLVIEHPKLRAHAAMSADASAVIRVGLARSRAEAIAAGNLVKCPDDGATLTMQHEEPARPPAVIAFRARCYRCNRSWRLELEAGPGWETPPTAAVFAASPEPSTLIDEATFRAWVANHATRLHSDDSTLARLAARDGLAALREVEKHARAAGRVLEPELRELAQRFQARLDEPALG